MQKRFLVKLSLVLLVANAVLFLFYWRFSYSRRCLHLPDKYCAKGDLVRVRGYTGREFWAIGYRLPEGTPLFSPIKADLHISSSPTFVLMENGKQVRRQGVRLIKADKRGKIKYIISFIFDSSPAKPKVKQVERGEKIGQLTTEPVYGDYNLLVSVSTWDSKKRVFVNDRGFLEKLILGKDEDK